MELILQLLESPKDPGITAPITDKITDVLGKISGLSADFDMNDWSDELALNGVAISPIQAAKCCRETLRTQVFLKSMYQAIQDILKKQPVVHVLYAGTGPFGTLVLPLLPMFGENQLQVTLLDIHQENIDALHKVAETLKVEPYIKQYIRADASSWQPVDNQKFDLIVSETMNTFLRREPQVSIFAHLQQFLAPQGSLIPEQIRLDAWLTDKTRLSTQDNSAVHLAEIFSLNKSSAKQVYEQGTEVLSGYLQLPKSSKSYSKLAFTTRIRVYGEHQLLDGECSLNLVNVAHDLDLRQGQKIPYYYAQKPVVEFIFDLPVYQPSQELALTTDIGKLKLFHLKRLWHKSQLKRYRVKSQQDFEHEWSVDFLLVELIGGELHQWLEYLYRERLAFSTFENWVETEFGPFSTEKLNRMNQALKGAYAKLNGQTTPDKDTDCCCTK